MKQHAPAPWVKENYSLVDANGERVVFNGSILGFSFGSDSSFPNASSNSERLVKCVNACEGLSNLELQEYDLTAMPALIDALEDAVTALVWWKSTVPEQSSEADNEFLLKANQTLNKAKKVQNSKQEKGDG